MRASYSGFEANTSGLTIGADARLSNEWIAGGAFSYGHTDLSQQDYRNGDSSDIDTYQFTAYAGRDFGAWYVDGMLGYAQQQYETKRDTSVAGVAKGNFDGAQLLAKVEAGYPIALGRQLTLTPLAGLEWSRLTLDSYTEQGAGALSLRVKGEHALRTASHLGARLEMAIDMDNGATLYPSAHARWVHQFDRDGTDTTAAFIGGGSSFVTPGQKLAADSYLFGVGLIYQQANGRAIGLQLDTEQATARSSYAGTVTVQWLF
ncbi:autotransporter outer membrane beta-barrel domain-containing protein [Denitromonas ohlonensis]|uniref:autotransporter outer membrane beta-barrel domain-containing protein n=1 Tax=Denitromonas ohlonensis TaxID=3078508 RepID=UPI0016425137|nr:autotransporter outer membrane beta-barrel domain-containing protein [Denitromonas ohlonensis]